MYFNALKEFNIILFINVDDLVFIQNEINSEKKIMSKELNTIAFVCATKFDLRNDNIFY